MNIGQLKYLVAIIDHGNFSSAAKSQFVTVQAVSKSISELEREIGHRLFIRENRGVTPTPFARDLYSRATRVLERFNDLEQFAASYSDPQR